MNSNYTILAVFDFSSEAYIIKSKLDNSGFKTMLMDEKTIDSDPLISNAIGGVKLLVHKNDFKEASEVYSKIRGYLKDTNGNDIHCPSCNSNQILIAPLQRRNIFFMLFPFFKKQNIFVINVKQYLKSPKRVKHK